MIKCKIIETGELMNLYCYNSESRIDCVEDIVGNSGTNDFIWDPEDEIYLVSKEAYNWWSKYLTFCEEDTNTIATLRRACKTQSECDALERIVATFSASDMEAEHDEWERIFGRIREEVLSK